MNIHILKHLVQVFFIPAGGVSLAWFGVGLLNPFGWNLSPIDWYASVLLMVLSCEWLLRQNPRFAILAFAATIMLILLVSLPILYVIQIRALPALGNYLDYAACVFTLFVLSLLSLRYRLTVVISDNAADEKTASVNGRFE